MTGWIVEKTTSCGWRIQWRRFRPVSAAMSRSASPGLMGRLR
jgi:hypothetical protein